MDTVAKVTIGLFIFCVLILFFKATKTMSQNYLEEHVRQTTDFDEIVNRQYEPTKVEIVQQQDNHMQQFDNVNPDDIKWVVNN